jgi:peptide methionine sulfoxide reductase MsrA
MPISSELRKRLSPRSIAQRHWTSRCYEVVPLVAFYAAEEHHQNYLKNNPDDSYIVYNDLPKLTALERKFPELYRRDPTP